MAKQTARQTAIAEGKNSIVTANEKVTDQDVSDDIKVDVDTLSAELNSVLDSDANTATIKSATESYDDAVGLLLNSNEEVETNDVDLQQQADEEALKLVRDAGDAAIVAFSSKLESVKDSLGVVFTAEEMEPFKILESELTDVLNGTDLDVLNTAIEDYKTVANGDLITLENTYIEYANNSVIVEEPPVVEAPIATPGIQLIEVNDDMPALVKVVIMTFNEYVTAMQPTLPTSNGDVVANQAKLYRNIKAMMSLEGDQFTSVMNKFLRLIHNNSKSVFSALYIFRGFADLKMSKQDRTAFERLLNLFTLTADSATRKVTVKQVDIPATVASIGNESHAQKVQSFYS